MEGLRTRVASQLQARADALAALSSSRAFLHRGFRDIEMLLEAGFTELEAKRALFMGVGKKKVPRPKTKAKAKTLTLTLSRFSTPSQPEPEPGGAEAAQGAGCARGTRGQVRLADGQARHGVAGRRPLCPGNPNPNPKP